MGRLPARTMATLRNLHSELDCPAPFVGATLLSMKFKLWIPLLAMLCVGCFQEYPENEGKNDNGGLDCKSRLFSSNITIQYNSHSTLPAKLSGTINGVMSFNECLSGNDTSLYTLAKTSDRSVTIIIRVEQHSGLYEQLFDENHKPRENRAVVMNLNGQDNCANTATGIAQMTRALNWQPQKSSPECKADAYTATVGN